jgi:hypothetical protein
MKTSVSRATCLAIALALVTAGLGCGGSGQRPRATSTPTGPAVRVGTNVVRIPGKSPADVASAAVLAAYPDAAHQPRGLVLTPQGDWRQTVVASQFAADPVDAAVLPTAGDFLPPGPSDLVNRLNPSGFPRAQGLQAVILGKAGNDVLGALQNRGLHLTQLIARSPEELSLKAVPFRGGWAHVYSDEIVVISSSAQDYALPGIAWSAYSGDTTVFVTRDSIPDATRQILVQREKLRLQKPTIYVVGPSSVIPDAVAGQLSAYGPVKRVAGDTPGATAIALARYKDPKTGFGWGLKTGPGNFVLMNVHDPGNVFGALTLAGAGPQAPLLLTDSARAAPPDMIGYLRGLRGSHGSQAFVLGDETSIGVSELSQVDRALSGAPGP